MFANWPLVVIYLNKSSPTSGPALIRSTFAAEVECEKMNEFSLELNFLSYNIKVFYKF